MDRTECPSLNGLCDSISNQNLPRHRWYEYKEGFSELLVRTSIAAMGPKAPRILDPFAGSGTTVVAAGRMGLQAVGIEVNPFASFVAAAKCTPRHRNRKYLNQTISTVLEDSKAEIASPLEGYSTFTQSDGAIKWLFNKSVLRGFQALNLQLNGQKSLTKPLRLALIAALMDCCNAKRDGKCLRYRNSWEANGFDSQKLRERFHYRANVVVADLAEDRCDASNLSVIQGDARKVLSTLRPSSFDLVVTSPPYLNSFDYSDVYRPELFAGGFVKTNADLRKVRLNTIRSHVQVSWTPVRHSPSPLLTPIYRKLLEADLWDERIPDMVRSYFADLRIVMRHLARVVRKGGEAWVVISTSAYGGVEIPVDEILMDISSRVGWKIRSANVVRKLRASGQHFNRIKGDNSPPLRETLIRLVRR
jgi:DNA modification methylase